MNERFEELAKQAEKITLDIPGSLTPEQFRETEQEIFAKLIVKEMCGMLEQCEDDVYSLEPSERPTEYIEWLYQWRTRFEKHFGIEE